jgi:uncharacterized coiled-coil protein SlyX
MKTSRSVLIRSLTFLSLAFVASKTHALNPPPGGGYPGGNTAEGGAALFHLTSGTENTAIGFYSLASNTTGQHNTAIGARTLLSNNGYGNSNTAVGNTALLLNTTGAANTAIGVAALGNNTTGYENTAIGVGALSANHTGEFNTALGVSAGLGVSTADNVICIGSNVRGANVSNTTWIGNIYGATTVSGATLPVVVSDGGQLGTAPSSRRFKTEIEPMDKASEAILALKPVTFQYKSDKTNTPQFGLIAEEVAKVQPDLVAHDKNGEVYSVRYDAVNAMLLNEFLKEHQKVEAQERKIEKQDATITELKSVVAHQQKGMELLAAQLKEQARQIQGVSAQVDVSKRAPQIAAH